MTLLFQDGTSDGLGNLGKYWNGYSAYASSPARTPGRTSASSLANPDWRALPADEHATFIVGGAFYWSGANSQRVITLKSDAGATSHVELRMMASGQIQVLRSGPTVLGNSALATPLTPNTWHHLAIKATLSDTVGTVSVQVDGVSVVALTGLDTKNGGTKTVFDQVQINQDQSSYWTDVYICNGATATNSDFLGDCVVETLFPTGNGNSSVLVGSDGNSVNNYALVNEATPDTSSYVGSAVSGDKDTYAFADMTHTTGTIMGVQTVLYAAKTDAGARSARAVARSSGTDYPGADVALSTGYTTYTEVRETDPATAAAWTISAVNAAEFGAEVRP